MNRRVLFSLVALGLMLLPSRGLRAEGNLEDTDASIVSPRVDAVGKLAVDAGLLYVLNKYVHSAGSDKAAIQAASAKLERTSKDFKTLAQEVVAAKADIANRNWAEINKATKRRGEIQRQIREMMTEREGLMKFSGDMRADRAVAKRAATKLSALDAEILKLRGKETMLAAGLNEVDELQHAAEALVDARDRAAKLVGNLDDSITHAKRVGMGLKVIRFVGNTAIAIDVVGQGWAFYDNSSEPLFFGGYSKLGQEAHELAYGKIKERVTPPTPKGEPMTREEIKQLPTRNSQVPSGNVPENPTHDSQGKKRNRRPPLLREEPNLDADIPALP